MRISRFTTSFLLAFIIAFLLSWNVRLRSQLNHIEYETVYDTVKVEYPVPKDSLVIRYVTQKLPVSDTISYYDTITTHVQDSVHVIIPITQKRYEEDSYTAWVSGYMPALDSIHFTIPTHYITQPSKEPLFDWSIGPQVGFTFGPDKGVQPYIGIGVQFGTSLKKLRKR